MDETRTPVLDPGQSKTKTGYLWALTRDERPWAGSDPSGVVFFYAPGRGGRHAKGFLKGLEGKLHVDGYAGCNAVAAPGNGVVGCYSWSHASASCARFRTATARRSPPKGSSGSPKCTPASKRSEVSQPVSGSPCARRAPRRWSRTSVSACAGNAPESHPSRAWVRSWPISATIRTGCRCSSPMGAWRRTVMWWKMPSGHWR